MDASLDELIILDAVEVCLFIPGPGIKTGIISHTAVQGGMPSPVALL